MPLNAKHLAEIIIGKKGIQVVIADIGVDGHEKASAVYEAHVIAREVNIAQRPPRERVRFLERFQQDRAKPGIDL
jgi:hypothetical protein